MLADQVLVVTGGSTGVGAAVIELARKSGARVAILDVNEDGGRRLAAVTGARFWRHDVSDEAAWSITLDAVEAELGPIRFAHLNAGIMTRPLTPALKPVQPEELTVERYRALVSVNLDGTFHGLRTLTPRIAAAGGGAITVTSSIAGLGALPFDPVYAMTKHALVGLVRSVAAAWAGGPVRISAICPGGISSRLLPPELRTDKTLSPADVAQDVLDLLADGPGGAIRTRTQRSQSAQTIE